MREVANKHAQAAWQRHIQQMEALEAEIQQHIEEARELKTLIIHHLNNAKNVSGLATTLKNDGLTPHSFHRTRGRYRGALCEERHDHQSYNALI